MTKKAIFDVINQRKPSKISEMVWAAVLGVAATYNAHAKSTEASTDELDAKASKDSKELKELKPDAAQGSGTTAAAAGGAAGQAGAASVDVDGQEVAVQPGEGGVVVDAAGQNPLVEAQETQSVQAHNIDAGADVVSSEGAQAALAAAAPSAAANPLMSEGIVSSDVASVQSGSGMESILSTAAPIISGMEFDTGLLALLGVGAVAIAVAGDDDDDVAEPNIDVNGVAIDGYVAGATVWADINGNGVQDAGETTVTDNLGNFSLPGVPSGVSVNVLAGGRDVLTGAIIQTDMTANVSSSGELVVSPFTTLLAAGADETALKLALGIPADTDLSTYDPIAALTGDDPAAAAIAEQILVAAQQVMTALQAGVAAGGSVDSVSQSLADAVTGGASSIEAMVNTAFASNAELAEAVNAVNSVIEDTMGGGNLVAALESGDASQLIDAIGAVAVAQSGFITAIENGNDLAGDWSDPTSINELAADFVPELNEANYEFLVENGLDLGNSAFNITDGDFLQQLLTEGGDVLEGVDFTVDDSLASFTDSLGAATGNTVVVDDLGDY